MLDADTLFKRAETRLSKFSLSDICNRNAKYDDAKVLFEKAGNLYKMSKDFRKAATAFINACECNKQMLCIDEAIRNYTDAFNCYKHFDKVKAVECANIIIDYYKEEGNANKMITFKKELIDIYDDTMDYDRLLIECKECLEFLSIDKKDCFAENMVKMKLANVYIKLNDCLKAGEIYENMAHECIERNDIAIKNALRYRAGDYIFDAGICYVGEDVIAAERAVDNFVKIQPSFIVSREYSCIITLIKAVINHDITKFTNSIWEYDKIKPLMNWQVELLSSIKEKMGEVSLI